MALTPSDIHHKEFHNARFGGYSEEDVDSFLDQVADDLGKTIEKNEELVEQVETLKAKLHEFEDMENSLQNALLTAAKSAERVKEEAKNEADSIVEEARKEAERILGSAKEDVKNWEESMSKMKSVKRDYLHSLKGLAESMLEQVERLEAEEEVESPQGGGASITSRSVEVEEEEAAGGVKTTDPGPLSSMPSDVEEHQEPTEEKTYSAEKKDIDAEKPAAEERTPQKPEESEDREGTGSGSAGGTGETREKKETPASSLVEEVVGAADDKIQESDREKRQQRLIRESKSDTGDEGGSEDRGGSAKDFFWE